MWDKKYRPKTFAEVLGQPGIVSLLQARLKNGTAFETSYVFAGGHGQGKTSLARIYARAMLCQQFDRTKLEPCNECENCTSILKDMYGPFAERDAASQGSVDNVRAIIEAASLHTPNAVMNIELFDEAHRMSNAAQDALLKPVEEKKLCVMLCTTEVENIRGPIRSRCEDHTVRKVSREEILARMQEILRGEGVTFEDDAVLIIIDHAGGHVRDILKKLEMVAQLGPITTDAVRENLRLTVVVVYYQILLALSDPKKAIELIEQAAERVSPEDIATGIAEAAMNSYRIANGMFADYSWVDRPLGQKVYEKYGPHVIRVADYFLRGRYTSRVSLLRDVLVLSQVPNNTPPEGALPPITFVNQVVSGGGSVVNSAPAPTTQPAHTTVPTSAPVTAPSPPPAVTPTSNGHASNGHTVPKDPPLHELDEKVGGEPTRMRTAAAQKPVTFSTDRSTAEEDRRLLKPSEWRDKFAEMWPGRAPHG